jgi:hypothetical protein
VVASIDRDPGNAKPRRQRKLVRGRKRGALHVLPAARYGDAVGGDCAVDQDGCKEAELGQEICAPLEKAERGTLRHAPGRREHRPGAP